VITKLTPLTKKDLDSTLSLYQFSTENSLIHSNLTIPGLLNRLIRVNKRISEHTSLPFAFWGGMALYAYLYELGMDNYNLIDFRIHNGKNDFDIGISITNISQIMDDFGWGAAEKRTQTGRIRPGWEIIDVMVRETLPSFPSKETEIHGNPIQLADPEEMIFQKMQYFATFNDSWPNKTVEIKWAIDIRFLKTYLKRTVLLNKRELEQYLKQRWEVYIREKNNMSRKKQYEVIHKILKGNQADINPKLALKEYFNVRFGGADYPVKKQLSIVFGESEISNIEKLIESKTKEEFEKIFRKIIRNSYKYASYKEVSEKADQAYSKLLPKKNIKKYPGFKNLDIQLDQA
jgi:hypothetical protein